MREPRRQHRHGGSSNKDAETLETRHTHTLTGTPNRRPNKTWIDV
jgi:hypothetical protein